MPTIYLLFFVSLGSSKVVSFGVANYAHSANTTIPEILAPSYVYEDAAYLSMLQIYDQNMSISDIVDYQMNN
jgi:hypothetical protein